MYELKYISYIIWQRNIQQSKYFHPFTFFPNFPALSTPGEPLFGLSSPKFCFFKILYIKTDTVFTSLCLFYFPQGNDFKQPFKVQKQDLTTFSRNDGRQTKFRRFCFVFKSCSGTCSVDQAEIHLPLALGC